MAGQVTQQQIYESWLRNGADDETARVMSAIAMAESSGYTAATNNYQGHSYMGLYQIGEFHGVDPTRIRSDDLDYQTQSAIAVLRSQGLGAWETYTNGMYQKYMSQGGMPEMDANAVITNLANSAGAEAFRGAAAAAGTQQAQDEANATADSFGQNAVRPSALDSPGGVQPGSGSNALDAPGSTGSPLDSPGGESTTGNPLSSPGGFDQGRI